MLLFVKVVFTCCLILICLSQVYTKEWVNETLHNEFGEIPIKSSKANIDGVHPHKIVPVTQDVTHFLGKEHLNPIIIGKSDMSFYRLIR